MGLTQGTIGIRDPARAPGSVPTDTVAVPRVDLQALGVDLRRKCTDLQRHFLFKYYPWYTTDPWRHWNHPDRQPPAGIATTSMPKLGPYDFARPRGRRAARPVDHGVRRGRNQYQLVGPWQL